MNTLFKIVMVALAATLLVGCFTMATEETDPLPVETASQNATLICTENRSPYRDLDFLIGKWDFFTLEGTKIADQNYSSRGQGCLVLEDWSELSGATGTGMNFVDPASGKWRQVWMSSRFHIDYSGGFNESGDFVLEGRMYPTNGDPIAEIRGVYSRQTDGSITKEFLRFDDKTNTWQRFFIGVARRKL